LSAVRAYLLNILAATTHIRWIWWHYSKYVSRNKRENYLEQNTDWTNLKCTDQCRAFWQ